MVLSEIVILPAQSESAWVPLFPRGVNNSSREVWVKNRKPRCQFAISLSVPSFFLFLFLFEEVIKADFPKSFLPTVTAKHPQSQRSAWKPACVYAARRAANLLISQLCWLPPFFLLHNTSQATTSTGSCWTQRRTNFCKWTCNRI